MVLFWTNSHCDSHLPDLQLWNALVCSTGSLDFNIPLDSCIRFK